MKDLLIEMSKELEKHLNFVLSTVNNELITEVYEPS